jgi:uncharacterized membrane protein
MNKSRLEAFSDGVLAILITIMVLQLGIPKGTEWVSLRPLVPVILSYVLSFAYLGIYWNNHHHMLHTIHRVSGGILWANLHLLFWLSLVPFVTSWMGESDFAKVPVALYGVVLLMSAIAYYILQWMILWKHGRDSLLSRAIGKDIKGKASPILYAIAIAWSFFNEWVAGAIYALVAFIWIIPDKRIERVFENEGERGT